MKARDEQLQCIICHHGGGEEEGLAVPKWPSHRKHRRVAIKLSIRKGRDKHNTREKAMRAVGERQRVWGH